MENIPFIFQQHIYEGTLYPNFVVDSAIQALKNFDARPDDVWIATFPRSGTHWMSEIVGLIRADGYVDKIDRSLATSSVSMIDMRQDLPTSRAEEENMSIDMTPHLENIRRAPSPRTMLTHLTLDRLPPNITKRAKVIYVARNPKDVVNSYFNLVCDSPVGHSMTWADFLKIFMDGQMMAWGSWASHVKSYWNDGENGDMLFLFFEDMKMDISNCIKRVAEFIERPLSGEALNRVLQHSSLAGMKKTYDTIADNLSKAGKQDHFTKLDGKSAFIKRGICGAWKDRFTVSQSEAFDKWYEEKMAGTDIQFVFE